MHSNASSFTPGEEKQSDSHSLQTNPAKQFQKPFKAPKRFIPTNHQVLHSVITTEEKVKEPLTATTPDKENTLNTPIVPEVPQQETIEHAKTMRQTIAPGARANTSKKFSTLERLATVPITAFKKLTSHRMPAIIGVTQLDKFVTIPAAAVQGVQNGNMKLSNTRFRLVGILFAIVAAFYMTWLVTVLNTEDLWFSLPFFFAMCYLTAIVLITIYNNWTRTIYELVRLPEGQEPTIAVCIPTYGETPEMVQTTIESVLSQDWPHNKLLIVVGDDSHRPAMKAMLTTLQQRFTQAKFIYHEPPKKGTPERKGSAKDGNLNSMLSYISIHHSHVRFIETRDADDVVGSPQFLRYVLGHLLRNKDVAYVQTIKDTLVSSGDPFGNRQTFFYRGVMFARNATNSVFPCGSGLVWRKDMLDIIGGFPTWNLVEDLYSGYVAMQHGLKGVYLSIVGAVGQVSPEDIPNVYKQLGTWALDTVRIFFWKNPWSVKGLTFRQRMQFTELSLFYMLSFPILVFLLTPVISLCTGIYPFMASNLDYVAHFWLYMACIELLLSFTGETTSFEEMWRARQMWLGMTFVFIKSTFLALFYGPNRKPAYKVTRKTQQAGIYLREVLMQAVVFLLLLTSVLFNLVKHRNAILSGADLGSILWAVLFLLLLTGIIRRSWFGYQRKKKPEQELVKKA